MRPLLIVVLLLIASSVAAEPIIVGDGFWKDGDFGGLPIAVQSGDENTIRLDFQQEWQDHVIYDALLSYFGFPAGTLRMTRSLVNNRPEYGGPLYMSFSVSLFPPGTSFEDTNTQELPLANFRALIQGSFLPGDAVAFGSDTTSLLGDQPWRGVISFQGTIAEDGGGIGEGSITLTRVPEPSTALLLVAGLLIVVHGRRNLHSSERHHSGRWELTKFEREADTYDDLGSYGGVDRSH